MTTDQFEIVDIHLHAWCIGGMKAYAEPHANALLDEKVSTGTLAQMNQLNIRYAVLSGWNNLCSSPLGV